MSAVSCVMSAASWSKSSSSARSDFFSISHRLWRQEWGLGVHSVQWQRNAGTHGCTPCAATGEQGYNLYAVQLSKYQNIDWRPDCSFVTLFLDTVANSSTVITLRSDCNYFFQNIIGRFSCTNQSRKAGIEHRASSIEHNSGIVRYTKNAGIQPSLPFTSTMQSSEIQLHKMSWRTGSTCLITSSTWWTEG